MVAGFADMVADKLPALASGPWQGEVRAADVPAFVQTLSWQQDPANAVHALLAGGQTAWARSCSALR